MHPVENLEVLYRARRYWHTPQLDQAIAKIIKHFGDRASIPLQFVTEFINGINRLHWNEGWCTFYEPCPVIKTTALEIVVVSQDLPTEVLEQFPDFCSGGKFHVNKAKLQQDGKAYHSRHGEYFYLNAPETAIALPEGKKLLEMQL